MSDCQKTTINQGNPPRFAVDFSDVPDRLARSFYGKSKWWCSLSLREVPPRDDEAIQLDYYAALAHVVMTT
jgi:hypothetical protein